MSRRFTKSPTIVYVTKFYTNPINIPYPIGQSDRRVGVKKRGNNTNRNESGTQIPFAVYYKYFVFMIPI